MPIGIQDAFARTAPDTDSLHDYCGLSVANIVQAARTIIEKS
jgi:transketolase C-terminal domain/subunit